MLNAFNSVIFIKRFYYSFDSSADSKIKLTSYNTILRNFAMLIDF